jgi:RNA polymerase sigma-70 factor (ECF subfamily)
LSLLSDAELVTLTQSGNLQAFNSLAQKWDASLYRFARRFLGNDEDAREVCQEALVKAYLNINRLRDPAKFKSWVHHIALNLCRDRSRSARVRRETVSYEEAVAAADTVRNPASDADREAYRTVLAEVLDDVMGRLSDEQRTAILLREYHGFTSEEIGEMTGVPATTVRTRIYYGLKSVRRMLNERGITGIDAS